MKKHFLFAALALALFTTACEKSYYDLPETPGSLVDISVAAAQPEFKFQLLVSPCIREGALVTFYTRPDDPLKYDIVWYVDGVRSGTGPDLDCVCGKEVSARVVRLMDNASGTATALLPACQDE